VPKDGDVLPAGTYDMLKSQLPDGNPYR
jgi:hypothetical protein